MNKIKEILDKLQKVANRETASRNTLMEMKDTDYQLLLDYITNLQEENERLKENNQNMQLEMARSWERIDKAIEYVKSKKAIINTDYIRIFDLFEIDEQGYTDELLNILKGENND